MADLDSLLPLDDMTTPRTPAQLAAWVVQTCDSIRAVPEAREAALMHWGPFKVFYEEIFPLGRFVTHRYPGREDILVTPNLDRTSAFDAVIRDYGVSPPSETMVEITSALPPDEHLRREHLVKHRFVYGWGPLEVRGTRRTGRQITSEPEFVEDTERLAQRCGLIKLAAEGKANKAARYGRSHVLVIAFDDWSEPSDEDTSGLKTFVTQHVLPLPLNFSALYLVGMSGHTYLSFPLR